MSEGGRGGNMTDVTGLRLAPHQPSIPKKPSAWSRPTFDAVKKATVQPATTTMVESFNDVYSGSRVESKDNIAARKQKIEEETAAKAAREAQAAIKDHVASEVAEAGGEHDRRLLEPLPLNGADKEVLRSLLLRGIDALVTVEKLAIGKDQLPLKGKVKRLKVALGTLKLEDKPRMLKLGFTTVSMSGLYSPKTQLSFDLHENLHISLSCLDYTVGIFNPVQPTVLLKFKCEAPHIIETALRGMVGQLGSARLFSDVAVSMPPPGVAFNRNLSKAQLKFARRATRMFAVRKTDAEHSLSVYESSTRMFNVYGDQFMGGKPGQQYANGLLKKAAGEITSLVDAMKFRNVQKQMALPSISVVDIDGKVLGASATALGATATVRMPEPPDHTRPAAVQRISEFGEGSADTIGMPSASQAGRPVAGSAGTIYGTMQESEMQNIQYYPTPHYDSRLVNATLHSHNPGAFQPSYRGASDDGATHLSAASNTSGASHRQATNTRTVPPRPAFHDPTLAAAFGGTVVGERGKSRGKSQKGERNRHGQERSVDPSALVSASILSNMQMPAGSSTRVVPLGSGFG